MTTRPEPTLGTSNGTVLLRDVGPDWGTHAYTYGPLPAPDAPRLVDELQKSGLTGRGGGAFPVWRKLQTAMNQRRRPEIIANASEGEPWSSKDRMLLKLAPHLVLDGLSVLHSTLRARTRPCRRSRTVGCRA